ncbi:MAG: ParB/RepB/Spo0J family partition protein [Rubrimonas sp.]
MTRKRRMFDIDIPDEMPPEPAASAAASEPRRGPMASAVRENADSLRSRAETEARIRAENDALAHEHVRLKKAGLITDLIALDAIDATKLTRDRAEGEDAEIDELKESIRAIGLSNPIRVEAAGQGRYELIQGWRRLQAFKALLAETGDDAYARIPAGIVAAGDALETSYRRMVDENLVRKDVSFAEMAMLAQAYAADPGTDCEDVDRAVAVLFKSAGYQKRTYIRAFAQLLDMLDGALKHPAALPRNLGLDLRRRLEGDAEALAELQRALAAAPARTADEEGEILRRAAAGQGGGQPSASRPASSRPATASRARTNFRLATPAGEVRCTASNGRLEVRGPADFASDDPRRLEAALAQFFRTLEAEG